MFLELSLIMLLAVQLAGSEFKDCVEYVYKSWLPGRSLVVESLAKRCDVDPSGQIVTMVGYCPWKDHLYQLEKEQGIEKPILFVLVSMC